MSEIYSKTNESGSEVIRARIVEDSVSVEGIRITTIEERHPRMIHSDFLTHRVFSRNGRSSRAVPVKRLLEEEIYIPDFRKNKPGMVATEEFSREELDLIEDIWADMAAYVRKGVDRLSYLGVHKQWANRPLEWFGYIDVVVTSTDWENYFDLRRREAGAAQPEIIEQAEAYHALLNASKPKMLGRGVWHLPYVSEKEREYYKTEVQLKLSAARCARVTIKPFDGDASIERELERANGLIKEGHWSPFEHQASPDFKMNSGAWSYPQKHRNFRGWMQQRAELDNGKR
jgi:thymidylate synthase ThyX